MLGIVILNIMIKSYYGQSTTTGEFDESQTSAGSISCLNIWSRTYSSEELLNFARCENNGDLFHLNTISGTIHVYGGVVPHVITTSGDIKSSL
mgnify:CR=1 FL=1